MITVFYEKLLINEEDCILKIIEDLSFPDVGKYPRKERIALDLGFIFSAMDNTRFLPFEKFVRGLKGPEEIIHSNSRKMEVRSRGEMPEYLHYTIDPLTDLTDEGILSFAKFLSKNLSMEGKAKVLSQFFDYNMNKIKYRMLDNKSCKKDVIIVRK